jgi:hypothetical protein
MNQRIHAETAGRALDFGTNPDPRCETERENCCNVPPAGSRPTGDEQPPRENPEQLLTNPPLNQDVDPVTNLPLFSTPMDNVIAAQAAVDSLEATGANALQINYAKALVAKAVEQ